LATYEGAHSPGKLLFYNRGPAVEVLATDTQVLSGSCLARSHRTFLVFDNEAVVIWDDLEGYSPQSFDYFLHTTSDIIEAPNGQKILQRGDGERCPLSFFSENTTTFSIEDAEMGETSAPGLSASKDTSTFLPGHRLKWQTQESLRQKFGLVLGCNLQAAAWRIHDSGWEISFPTATARWSAWFNRKADGSVMHNSPISKWYEIETDAYALVLKEENKTTTLYGIQSSFMRRGGKVLRSSLARSSLIYANL
jgi:hypothetical protein